ncbi:MAG: YdcF family protein [Hyphomicrobiales bacterium]
MPRRLIARIFQTIGTLTLAAAVCAAAAAFILPGWLQFEDGLEKADYIVPLADDYDRIMRAAELYREGLAPKVLLSNARIGHPRRTQRLAEELGYRFPRPGTFRGELLEYLQVPADAVDSFGDGHVSTVEEAEALKAKLGDGPVRLILVTAPYHARRSKIIFGDILPNADIRIANSRERGLSGQWWRDQYSAQVTVGEAVKLLYYLFGGGFRSSAGAPG